MPADRSFDVIVAGAGPAGSSAAHALAAAGVHVAILDRATFPRVKACGGGLQHKLLRDIPFDISPVIRNTMRGICFTHCFADRYTRRSTEPIVYGALRSEFDTFLLEAAAAKGARRFDNVAVQDVSERNGAGVDVTTSAGDFRCRVLIGADGANGVVRRHMNPEPAFFNQAGLYVEIPKDEVVPGSYEADLMRVDWGTLPSGYAWIFPKDDFINIGVGAPVAIGRTLRGYLRDFLAREGIVHPEQVDGLMRRATGHKLPSYTPRTTLQRGNILVIGDAAGLIEPMTGDGISYGVHSAGLAATAVRRFLGGETSTLAPYAKAVERELVPEIAFSRKLMTLFNTFPRMAHEVFVRNDRVWDAFCRVLRGDASYDIFRRRKLGLFSFVWHAIDRFTLAYETRRLARPDADEMLFQKIVRSTVGAVIKRV